MRRCTKTKFFMLNKQLPHSFMPPCASFLPAPWHTSLHSDEFSGKDRHTVGLLVISGRFDTLL